MTFMKHDASIMVLGKINRRGTLTDIRVSGVESVHLSVRALLGYQNY
jgi:hypothetical protein